MCTSQRSGDGMDVDNESDYKEMVQKIHEHGISSTKIFIDIKDVEKLPMLSAGGTVEDEEDETAPIAEASAVRTSPSHATWALILQIQSSKVSDMDARLMRFRLMLQTRYKNEFDDGYTYVGPTGLVTLTPSLMMDWCRALVIFFVAVALLED